MQVEDDKPVLPVQRNMQCEGGVCASYSGCVGNLPTPLQHEQSKRPFYPALFELPADAMKLSSVSPQARAAAHFASSRLPVHYDEVVLLYAQRWATGHPNETLTNATQMYTLAQEAFFNFFA